MVTKESIRVTLSPSFQGKVEKGQASPIIGDDTTEGDTRMCTFFQPTWTKRGSTCHAKALQPVCSHWHTLSNTND